MLPEEAERLLVMVRALLRGSRLEPGGRIARGVNTTGRTLLFPGINTAHRSTYPAFWIRDPAWIAEAGLIDAVEIEGWLSLMIETMHGPIPRFLESGGLIVPFSIADHINLDGSPVYYPGTYDGGETQGPPWGTYPPHDDQYWPTFTAYALMRLTGDRTVGARSCASRLGEIPVWLACDLAHHAMRVNPDTGLCWAADAPEQHQVDWGYNDSITKTGDLLFPSLLRIESCHKLAALLEGGGQLGRASAIRSQAARLRAAIVDTFVSRFEHGARTDTWLVSAGGTGRLPDVWGTALAVHRGFVPDDVARALATSLLHAYREGTAVFRGQIRHVPSSFGYWPVAASKPGTYQNGAYWGYASGWYVDALSRVDRKAARDCFLDYLGAMEEGWNDSGEACAWECVNPALDHYQNPGYLATVAIPYVSLAAAGLLPPHR